MAIHESYAFPTAAAIAHCSRERGTRRRRPVNLVIIDEMEKIMSMYGANPEQLTNLGTTLNRQIDTIAQLMSTVDSVLSGTTWHGPARERFVEDWNGSFKSALNRLNEAFGVAGRDCVARSEELRRVMGSGA